MSSTGRILYKKKMNMENVPQQFGQGIEISNISKIKNLTAIAKKKEAEAVAAAEKAALLAK